MSKFTEEQKYFRSIIDMVLDGEANRDQITFCMDKIATCPYCRTKYQQEKAIKQCIKKYDLRLATPQDLVSFIQEKIQEV